MNQAMQFDGGVFSADIEGGRSGAEVSFTSHAVVATTPAGQLFSVPFARAELSLDVRRLAHVDHLDDGDELVELLDDLLEDFVVARRLQRYVRDRGLHGLVDGQIFDVESARAEHPGDPGKHAEFVFDENGNHVTHDNTSAR